MFSGIIKATKKAKRIAKNNEGYKFTFPTPAGWHIGEGESIAIDGICSTVASLTKDTFSVFWMPETIRRTSLASLPDDHVFNLEQPLTLQTFIDGHLVTGHVDTTATVVSVAADGDATTVQFQLDSQWTKYLIYKGSVTINGVSLTVVNRDKATFSVSLIPYTLTHTNLGSLHAGDLVNIEIDMMAKYIEQLLPTK